MTAASPTGAQVPADPRLEGRVERGESPVPSATVVLHRVTPDTAGEVDTVRAGPAGGFSFSLPSVPDPGSRGEVYFASVEYLGILYFGPAIHRPIQLDSLYLIQVYDTAAVPPGGVELPVAMRYVILDPDEEGWRVTDLIQLRNEGDQTLVPVERGLVWSYPLPPGARAFELGRGDASPGGVSLSGGILHVTTPIPPGLRQYVFRYELGEPGLRLPLPGRTEQMELLVQEPAPPLAVQGLQAMEAVEMEPGTTYRRFAATSLDDATVRVVPGSAREDPPVEWIAVILALVLAAGALWAVRRGAGGSSTARVPVGAPGGGPGDAVDRRQRLVMEVARIDERLDAEEVPADRREELEARRRSLIRQIRGSG